MKKLRAILFCIFLGLIMNSVHVQAADYQIDTKGTHASIKFRVKHLGISWLWGRFNRFAGNFSYDADKPETNRVRVVIDTASVDSNHSLRDKHLRGTKFLEVTKFPEAKFISTKFIPKGDGKFELKGVLELKGIKRELAIQGEAVGAGPDPWGGYRRGFTGRTRFALADFGITKNLGPESKDVELILDIVGIRR